MVDKGRRIGSLVTYVDTYRLSNQQVQVSIIFLIMEISGPSIAQVNDNSRQLDS